LLRIHAGLPDADHVAIRRANGGVAGVPQAPGLILTAEDAAARRGNVNNPRIGVDDLIGAASVRRPSAAWVAVSI